MAAADVYNEQQLPVVAGLLFEYAVQRLPVQAYYGTLQQTSFDWPDELLRQRCRILDWLKQLIIGGYD